MLCAVQAKMATGSAGDLDALILAKKADIADFVKQGLAAAPEDKALMSLQAKVFEDDLNELRQRREALRQATTGKPRTVHVCRLLCICVCAPTVCVYVCLLKLRHRCCVCASVDCALSLSVAVEYLAPPPVQYPSLLLLSLFFVCAQVSP